MKGNLVCDKLDIEEHVPDLLREILSLRNSANRIYDIILLINAHLKIVDPPCGKTGEVYSDHLIAQRCQLIFEINYISSIIEEGLINILNYLKEI